VLIQQHLNDVLSRIEEIRARFEPESDGMNTPSAGSESPSGTSPTSSFHTLFNQKTNQMAPAELESLIQDSSHSLGIDSGLVKAVINAESGFNPYAVSKAGALGLMQLMPATAQSMGVENPFNAAENIQGGAKYLKTLLDKYKSVPNAVAAYNAGPGNVDKYHGIPPFSETQQYVQRVLGLYQQYSQKP
jgi:soluble lytic murein transglycosylase-like protein